MYVGIAEMDDETTLRGEGTNARRYIFQAHSQSRDIGGNGVLEDLPRCALDVATTNIKATHPWWWLEQESNITQEICVEVTVEDHRVEHYLCC